jgi:hypothetical protein
MWYLGRVGRRSSCEPVGRYVFVSTVKVNADPASASVGFGANKVFTTAGTADKVAFLDKLSNGKVHPINYREQSEFSLMGVASLILIQSAQTLRTRYARLMRRVSTLLSISVSFR